MNILIKNKILKQKNKRGFFYERKMLREKEELKYT